jgi:hypothetical protein
LARNPGEPASHFRGIAIVVRSKSAAQGGFLISPHEQVGECKPREPINQQSGRASQENLPHTIKVTHRYIGLRTYRYKPRTTRTRGGSIGASVPRPERANSKMQTPRSAVPRPMRSRLIQSNGIRWSNTTDRSPKKRQGRYPAKKPGKTIVQKRLRPASQARETGLPEELVTCVRTGLRQ